MYDRKCFGTAGDPIHITDAFKEKFDWSKLMALNYTELLEYDPDEVGDE